VRRWNATAGALATKTIVGLNVAVFLVTAAQGGVLGRGGDLQSRLALYGPAVAGGEWYRLVTAGFVHYGLIHLAFNMVLLYRFGEMIERAVGRVRFVALYTGALLAGSFGALLLTPNAVTAGASGAVFGLVGAAALGMRQRGISVWQSGVGGLLLINLVLTVMIPGISVGGHLGGLAGGAAAGSVMLRPERSRRTAVGDVSLAVVIAAVATAGAIWAAGR
jgi:membrane associated rhomboid family serine protease